MRVATDTIIDIHVLSCEGELTMGASADAFEAACTRAVDAADARLVLDLTRLTYLDSAGLGAIVASAKRAAQRGTVIKVALRPEGSVRRVFVVTQLERAFEIFDSAAAAAGSFR